MTVQQQTSLLPQCPAWCELPAGHWHTRYGTEFIRRHSIGFGQHEGEPLVEVEAQELIDAEGRVEVDEPSAAIGSGLPDYPEPEMLLQLARAATDAAAFVEREKDSAWGPTSPDLELAAELHRVDAEQPGNPSAVTRLIQGALDRNLAREDDESVGPRTLTELQLRIEEPAEPGPAEDRAASVEVADPRQRIAELVDAMPDDRQRLVLQILEIILT